MGFFTYVCGELKCARCSTETSSCIQTKLFRATAENSSRRYSSGDSVTVDGLADYHELNAWQPGEPLRVVMGDWDCPVCNLNYQWALVEFRARDAAIQLAQPFQTTIARVATFIPMDPERFHGIHRVESDLVELAFRQPSAGGIDAFQRLPAKDRAIRIAEGYRAWLAEQLKRT